MSDLILHHYPPSPVGEKIRKTFGLKGLAWKSVEQNRLPDRPELFAMTGGYRRIPVLHLRRAGGPCSGAVALSKRRRRSALRPVALDR